MQMVGQYSMQIGTAIEFRADADSAGQVKIKLFLGIGLGEKSTVNIPVSIGGELYSDKP